MVCEKEEKSPIGFVIFCGVALIAAMLFVFPSLANAASLYFAPAAQNLVVGQTVVVTVGVSSADQAMNAVSGDISFPSDKLQVLSVSKQDSIVGLWVRDPSFTNGAGGGDVHFEGIVLNPGFTGPAGSVVKVTFQAVAAGDAPVSFSTGSVLANDGNGTNILESLGTADYSIVPASGSGNSGGGVPSAPIVVSPTHPDQHSWYNTTTLELSWRLPSGATGVSYGFSQSTQYVLASRTQGLLSDATYDLTGDAEGTWHFFVKLRNVTGWGPIAIYNVNMDFSPPEPFVITEIPADASAKPSQPTFTWHATDTVSGIKNYMVQIGNADWIDASTMAIPGEADVYQLPPQAPGTDIPIAVEAFDEAGNMTLATTTFSVSQPSVPQVIYCTFTFNVSDLKACGWFGEVIAFALEWGLLILLIALILTLMYLAIHAMVHKVRLRHMASHRELLKMREELHADLRRLDKEFNTNQTEGKINLNPASLRKKQQWIEREIEHIKEDIKKDIERIDDADKLT